MGIYNARLFGWILQVKTKSYPKTFSERAGSKGKIKLIEFIRFRVFLFKPWIGRSSENKKG